MKVFVTGASGRVGSHVIPHLLTRGHTVSGLVRSTAAADTLKALGQGITAVIGSMTDRGILTSQAKSHDAVIHCAMDLSSGNIETAAQLERSTIQLFADALEGTGKVFIMSGAAGFLPPGSDERSMPPAQAGTRAQNELIDPRSQGQGDPFDLGPTGDEHAQPRENAPVLRNDDRRRRR